MKDSLSFPPRTESHQEVTHHATVGSASALSPVTYVYHSLSLKMFVYSYLAQIQVGAWYGYFLPALSVVSPDRDWQWTLYLMTLIKGTDFTGLWIKGSYKQGHPRALLNFTLWHYVWNRCCDTEGKANCEVCSVLWYRNSFAEVIYTTWVAGDSDSSVSWCPISLVNNWF